MSPELVAKIRKARMRLNISRFITYFVWSLVVALSVAAIVVALSTRYGWAISAAVVLEIAGAVASLSAGTLTYFTRRTDADAAAELDTAFGLKERLSTLLSLPVDQSDTPAGIALREDMERRVAELNVAEKTPLRAPRFSWAPAIPFALLVAATFLSPLQNNPASARTESTEAMRKRAAKETENLAKKIAERQKKLADKNSEVEKDLKSVASKIEEISKQLGEKKLEKPQDAVLKLSDLAKSIEERRKKYDSVEKMKSALSKIPNMKDGPAEKFSEALKQGDFKEAAEQMLKIKQQLMDKKLDPQQQKKLADQLNKLQQAMKDMANLKKREEELRKNIKDPKQLEQALQKLAMEKKQLEQLQKIADKLQQCAQCAGKNQQNQQGQPNQGGKPNQMSQADAEQLAKELKDAAEMLSQMASNEMAREALNEMLDELAETRNSMMGGMPSDQLRNSMSMYNQGGVGMGSRSEAPDDTKSRLQKAQTKQNKGRVFVTGLGEGKNFKGDTTLTVKEMVINAAKTKDESVTRQRVPKEYQDHAREYFDLLEKSAK